ncbi:hypothetical protein FocTR4_00012626 [Fusarium oxysporum f. sp. cubense]|nr:hypothetical protein FocTR4_00012626 [Fusarium oxysporum f. sp. cubense]
MNYFEALADSHMSRSVSQLGRTHFMTVGMAPKDDNAHLSVSSTNISNSDLKGATISNGAINSGPGDMYNGSITIYHYHKHQCPDPAAHLPKQASSQNANCSQRRCRDNRKLVKALLKHRLAPLRRRKRYARRRLRIIV